MKLKGKQKKIDVAKPFGKITGEDFAKLREDKRSPFMGGGIAYAGGGRAMKRKMYSEGTPAIKKPKNPIRKEPLKVKDPRREMKLSPELKKILKKRFDGVQRKK